VDQLRAESERRWLTGDLVTVAVPRGGLRGRWDLTHRCLHRKKKLECCVTGRVEHGYVVLVILGVVSYCGPYELLLVTDSPRGDPQSLLGATQGHPGGRTGEVKWEASQVSKFLGAALIFLNLVNSFSGLHVNSKLILSVFVELLVH
jgi:hypothetical protein